MSVMACALCRGAAFCKPGEPFAFCSPCLPRLSLLSATATYRVKRASLLGAIRWNRWVARRDAKAGHTNYGALAMLRTNRLELADLRRWLASFQPAASAHEIATAA